MDETDTLLSFKAKTSGGVVKNGSLNAAAATPLGTLGYAQVTANQTGITTEVDLTSLTVTVTAVTGRRLRITGKIEAASSVAADTLVLNIKESTTVLNRALASAPAATGAVTMTATAIVTPTAASHTYKLSLSRVGTGTAEMDAASTQPAYILCEDVGV